MVNISVLKDFSRTPGPRYKEEGSFSGEEFRNNILLPKLKEAIIQKKTLLVDLDGVSGYGTSFLEEAFGGLIRVNDIDYKTLKNTLKLKSEEDDIYIEEIWEYIEDAKNKKDSNETI